MTETGRLYLIGEYINAADQLLGARGMSPVEPVRYLLSTAARELRFVLTQLSDAPAAAEDEDAKNIPWEDDSADD
jgi:hypothetical protein